MSPIPGFVKRLTIWAPLVLLVLLVVGYARRTRSGTSPESPSFAAPKTPIFAPIVSPFGKSSIRGRLLDDKGAPLAEVAIYARSGDVPHWTFTDASGRFALDELEDEVVELHPLAWGRTSRAFPVKPDGEEHELRLDPPLADPPKLPVIARAKLAGSVAPAIRTAGASYQLVLLPIDPPDKLQGAVPRRTSVAVDGTFAIDDLALGDYRVVVLPSWAAGGSWPDLVAAGSAKLEHQGEMPALVVQLADGSLDGRVEASDGSPIGGALVLTTGADQRTYPAIVTQDDGSFALRDLPSGDYQVEVRAGDDAHQESVHVEPAKIAHIAPTHLSVRRDAVKTESKP